MPQFGFGLHIIRYSSLFRGANFPLDLFPGAAAAYSLRKLRTDVLTPVRIRRSSDNAEVDVYFDEATKDADGNITISLNSMTSEGITLGMFIGTDDGFVSVWYDQSENGLDLTAAVSNVDEFLIINSGVLYKDSKGQIAVKSDKTKNNTMTNSTGFSFDTLSAFTVIEDAAGDNNNRHIIFNAGDIPTSGVILDIRYDNPYNGIRPAAFNGVAQDIGEFDKGISKSQITTIFANGLNVLHVDGVERLNAASTMVLSNSPYLLNIGSNITNALIGSIHEVIFYNTDQTDNRAAIEHNQNKYYKVYNEIYEDQLLDKYPDAVAAYSLRQLKKGLPYPVVRVRRDSDNAEQDFNQWEVYDGTLTTFCGAGSGQITSFYDQNGSLNSNETNVSNQTHIVNLGVLLFNNGKPSWGDIAQGSITGTYISDPYPYSNTSEVWGFYTRNTQSHQATDYLLSVGNVFSTAGSFRAYLNAGTTTLFVECRNNSGVRPAISFPITRSANQLRIVIRFVAGKTTAEDTIHIWYNDVKQVGSVTVDGGIEAFLNDSTAFNTKQSWNAVPNEWRHQESVLMIGDQTNNFTGISADINTYYNTNPSQEVEDDQLLDLHPNAAAAYSLRQLKKGVEYPVVRLRRSLDDTELDFTAFGINDGSAEIWAQGGDAFVSMWYDQSGNAIDVENTNAVTQRKLVISGQYKRDNGGKIAIDFPASPTVGSYTKSWTLANAELSVFAKGDYNGASNDWTVSNNNSITPYGIASRVTSGTVEIYRGAGIASSPAFNSNQYISTAISTPSGAFTRGNGLQSNFDTQTNAKLTWAGTWTLAICRKGGSGYNDTFSEVIIYNSDESTNIESIEGNMNEYYDNIIPTIEEDRLLDTHPNASAAYSLRQLKKGFYIPLVRVRRSSDDAEADFTELQINDGSLETWVGANDGFVVTWYDQSGNAFNATRATLTEQPTLVVLGIIQSKNGKPAVTSEANSLDYSGMGVSTNGHLMFVTCSLDSGSIGQQGRPFSYSGTYTHSFRRVSSGLSIGAQSYSVHIPSVTFEAGSQDIYVLEYNGASSNSYRNRILEASFDHVFTYDTIDRVVLLGLTTGISNPLKGSAQEFLFYPDKNADREGIEIAMNSYYNTYPTPSESTTDGLKDLYPTGYKFGISNFQEAKGTEYPVIRVRRSSDDAERDFYASDLEFSTEETPAILTWVGSGDGAVVKVYDQSGNGYPLENTTVSTEPLIVKNGLLVRDAENNAVWDNVGKFGWRNTANLSIGGESEIWIFSPVDTAANSGYHVIAESNLGGAWAVDGAFQIATFGAKLYVRFGRNTFQSEIRYDLPVGRYILSINIKANATYADAHKLYANGVQLIDDGSYPIVDTSAFTDRPLSVMARNIIELPFEDSIPSLHLYTGDQSATREGIELFLNERHKIFDVIDENRLLDLYPEATAAYSLRQLRGHIPLIPVAKVRRTIDDAEKDFNEVEILDGTMLTWVGTLGTDNGFVSKWYDQSGKGNDATNDPLPSNTGQLVIAGVQQFLFGKPTMYSSAKWYPTTVSVNNGEGSCYSIVAKINANSSARELMQGAISIRSTNGYVIFGGTSTGLDVQEVLLNCWSDGTDGEIRYNAVNKAIAPAISTGVYFNTIMNRNTNLPNGSEYFSEAIVWAVSNKDVIDDLDAKVNEYYNAYPWQEITTDQLLDKYPSDFAISNFQNSKGLEYPLVRVRRASDDTEQDFTQYGIEDGRLESFAQGGDAFVVQPYDQANGFAISQVIAGSQPTIVSGGVIVTNGGKAAWDNNGKFGWKSTAFYNWSDNNEYWFHLVGVTANGATRMLLESCPDLNGRTTGFYIITGGGTTNIQTSWKSNGQLSNNFYNILTDGLNLLTIHVNSKQTQVWVNGTDMGLEGIAGDNPIADEIMSFLARNASSLSYNTKWSEFIIRTGNKGADRIGIETILANRYGITYNP